MDQDGKPGSSGRPRSVDTVRPPPPDSARPPKAAAKLHQVERSERVVIGWNEYVDLPEWSITGIKAKVDSGARTSALHVDNIRELHGGRVRFDVVLHRRKVDRRVTVETHVLRKSRVRSSTGHFETRYIVTTLLRVGPVEKQIEISLASRDTMLFRMLLGRKALAHDFLIDASKRCLATERPKRKKKKPAPISETPSS